jgi:hypothetical protein
LRDLATVPHTHDKTVIAIASAQLVGMDGHRMRDAADDADCRSSGR